MSAVISDLFLADLFVNWAYAFYISAGVYYFNNVARCIVDSKNKPSAGPSIVSTSSATSATSASDTARIAKTAVIEVSNVV